jgi:hypothetical protein
MKPLCPSAIRRSEWHKDRDEAQWKRIKTQVLDHDHSTCVYLGLGDTGAHQGTKKWRNINSPANIKREGCSRATLARQRE